MSTKTYHVTETPSVLAYNVSNLWRRLVLPKRIDRKTSR